MRQRLKRLLSSLLLCAALAGSLAVPASAARFTDVPAGHWAADSIARCVELKFFQGETSSRFGLGHQMTRSAFVVVLCRFFGWETAKPTRATYPDVPVDAWYAGAIEAAYANGAITDQNDAFRPGDPITREELAVMLVRALGYGTIAGMAQELPMPFRDVQTNVGYITMAYDLGLVGGTTADTFSPEKTATREQVAVILMRLYDKLHAAAPGKAAIIASAEGLGDLTGFEAVAVSAGRLISSGGSKVNATMKAEDAAAARDSVRKAGAKALLYVEGGPTALNGTPAEAAAVLAEAVQSGGYDGLFLDIAKLKDDKELALTRLVQTLKPLLGDKLLYLVVEAPAWQGAKYLGYRYETLGKYVDRMVLRVASHERVSKDFPTSPIEPLEELYYALGEMQGKVDAAKLSLLLTTTGTVWTDGKKGGSVSGAEIAAALAGKDTEDYYSSRYACAYLSGKTGDGKSLVIWYLNMQSAAERMQLLRCFGVDQVCLTDLQSASPDLLMGLR